MNQDYKSNYFKEFIEEIKYKNRNPKNTEVLKLLDNKSTNPFRTIEAGTILYRSRIIEDESKINQSNGFFGYSAKESFVPPIEKTNDLRANYKYIPYLYCAGDPYTSLVEVRPRLGAHVSVARIKVNNDMLLLDFTRQSIPNDMSKEKVDLFDDISSLFSKPIAIDDEILDYIPTQFIAEYAKNLGYDGIAFRSSLTPELKDQDTVLHKELDRYNIVIFNYENCEPIKSNVFEIIFNHIESKQIDSDTDKIDMHIPLLDMYY